MKRHLSFSNILALGLVFTQSTFASLDSVQAALIRFDERVSVSDGHSFAIDAYRSQQSCRHWQYVPGMLHTYGSVRHKTGARSVKIGYRNLPSYTTALKIQLTPALTRSQIKKLKSEIVTYLQAIKGQPCYDPNAQVESISLTPALARLQPVAQSLNSLQRYQSVSYRFSPMHQTESGKYIDWTHPLTMTLEMDATDPVTRHRIESQFAASQDAPVELARLSLNLDVELDSVDSRLSIQGDVDAGFDSLAQNTTCTITTDQKSLSPAAAAFKVASDGIGRYGKSALSEGVECQHNMIQELMGNSSKYKVVLDHRRTTLDKNGTPLTTRYCDGDKKCVTVPLEEFVNTRLMAKMLLNNFEIAIDRAADRTYQVTLKRKGKNRTQFQSEARYVQRVRSTRLISIPVYGSKLPSTDLDFSEFSKKDLLCAQNHYFSQALEYGPYLGKKPLPVSPACR